MRSTDGRDFQILQTIPFQVMPLASGEDDQHLDTFENAHRTATTY